MRINLSSRPNLIGILLGLVYVYFRLTILCVLLILSRLIRATISVFFVPCCSVLLSFYLVLSYMFELNKWRHGEEVRQPVYGRRKHIGAGLHAVVSTEARQVAMSWLAMYTRVVEPRTQPLTGNLTSPVRSVAEQRTRDYLTIVVPPRCCGSG